MAAVCNCTDLNRITKIVDGLVKEAAEEKAHLANQFWVIVLAYTFVILPWGFLYNVDFISEKWRTVYRTRFLAYVHMFFAIVPMPFIIFYAHLQQTSEDYKEMMAAVIAILMSFYHVMRTGFGLIQLASFSKWCSVLIERMWKIKMIHENQYDGYPHYERIEQVGGIQGFMENPMGVLKKVFYCIKKIFFNIFSLNSTQPDIESDIPNIQTGPDDDDSSRLEDAEKFDHLMGNVYKVLRVNNTVVDNEIGGTDITVKIKSLETCMEYAKSWLKGSNSGGADVSITDFLSVEEKELCAVRWSGTFLSAFGELWGGQFEKIIDLEVLFWGCQRTLKCLNLVTFPLNGRKVRFGQSKYRGPYNSVLDLTTGEPAPDWLRYRKRELENLMSAFPATGEKGNLQRFCRPDLELVHSLLFGQSMDEAIFYALVDYRSKFTIPRDGWFLLLWQNGDLPSDHESDLMNPISLPPFPWRQLLVPLWDNCTNWRVLQASVHRDNSICIELKSRLTKQPACWFTFMRKKYNRRIGPMFTISGYVGVVLETVRTFLARWISGRTPTSPEPNWCPTLPKAKVQFSVNQDGFMDNENSKMSVELWRWECQSKLQETIAGMDTTEVNLPSCIELILLFILGLPGGMRRTGTVSSPQISERGRSGLINSLEFHPSIAPQNVKVRVQIFEIEGKKDNNVEIDLVSGASDTVFHWEDWINSVMGFIKWHDIDRSDIEKEVGRSPWRKRTPRKVNLRGPLVTVSGPCQELRLHRGEMQVWTGWPFFDIKIVQFEMDEWMRARGYLNEDREYGNHNMDLTKYHHLEIGEEALSNMAEWSDEKWKSIVEENKKETSLDTAAPSDNSIYPDSLS